MRCPRCGNENQETNRYCGMCGATLVPSPPAGTNAPQRTTPGAAASAVSAAAPPTRTEPPRPAAPASVSGPSFLGLNDPPRKRNPQMDSHSGSRNLDYLLEDNEPPHHGSGGRIAVTFILLALAAGFGYLTWKNHGLGWLNSKKSAPAAASEDSPQSSATDGSSSTASGAAPSDSQPPAAAPPPASKPPESTPPPPSGSANTPKADTTPSNADANSGSTPNAAPESDGKGTPPEKTTNASPPTPVAHTDKPKRPSAAVPKPHASVPARAADPVVEAQKYLYGRGAAQDCEHGLRILKPAANSGNANAMIEMGALYSAGLCAPHDLPTAYHWFAVALRKDPNNQTAQSDLTKLWGEMTQPERQLAIKLTQ